MIELRESAPAPVDAAPAPEPEAVEEPAPVAPESDDRRRSRAAAAAVGQVSVGGNAEGAFDAVPSFAASADPSELRDAPVHEIAPRNSRRSSPPASSTRSCSCRCRLHRVVGEAERPRIRGAGRHRRGARAHGHDLGIQSPARFRVVRAPASGLRGVHRERILRPPVHRTIACRRRRRRDQPIGLIAWATRAASRGATALYLRAGVTPLARVDDRLEPLATDAVDNWRFEELVTEFNNGRSKGWELGSHGEMNWQVPSVGQVSCWSFADDQGTGLMMRLRLQLPTARCSRRFRAASARPATATA